MDKEEILKSAKSYSNKADLQKAYIAGFQEVCDIIKQKADNCYNEEFCDEMDNLAQVKYIDFQEN